MIWAEKSVQRADFSAQIIHSSGKKEISLSGRKRLIFMYVCGSDINIVA
jgi:hypothetical protein